MQGSSDPNVELLDAAAFVSHLVPADSVYAFLAEHRRRLFPDDAFADLFPSGRGRPSQPADVIASVLVLQSLAVGGGPGRGVHRGGQPMPARLCIHDRR